ncbi:MAG: TonB-dependent receptor [Bacteroidota bacterium]|nr:TonB-dependent receptor [Bacteroidota bacterium]
MNDVIHNGDPMFDSIPTIKQKALKINLNDDIYGTFAEIGAGQETVRQFFRVGGASGTIAKSLSAYDKSFSDAIYGIEDDKRYVTQNRLRKMLTQETGLIEKRVGRKDNPNKMFFCYANTVATIDFAKKFKGHGWVGIRFQIDPKDDYNEIILHVRFKENIARQQQETLGILGTNLIYSAFYKYNEPKKIIKYLYDNLDKEQLEIDTINFSGPVFKDVDNRIMSLELVKNGLTEAVLFGPNGQNILPAAALYKKNILALRGRFRPVTKVNEDMYVKSLKLFLEEKKVKEENTIVIFEITLADLENKGEIDEKDFMDRAKLLGSLGETVLVSNYKEYYRLVEYFSLYTDKKIGLCMGVNNLIQVFDPKYYIKLSGGILEAFGKLFFKKLKVYLYPVISEDGEIITSENLKVHPRIKELYKFSKFNGKVVDVKDYDKNSLKIYSEKVLEQIKRNKKGWEKLLPKSVASKIKKQKLFGFKG